MPMITFEIIVTYFLFSVHELNVFRQRNLLKFGTLKRPNVSNHEAKKLADGWFTVHFF